MSQHVSDSDDWLTLAQAASELHVHPTTLRRWANNGDIPVMVTPGGHRRFARADIERFQKERHRIRLPGSIENLWANSALAETRERMSGRASAGWMSELDERTRSLHRTLGQRLVALLRDYVSDRDGGEPLLQEARRIGREYGRLAKALGLPLKQVLETSMFFRDTLVQSTMQLPDKVRMRSDEKMRMLERTNQLLNAVQLAVAEEYDVKD